MLNCFVRNATGRKEIILNREDGEMKKKIWLIGLAILTIGVWSNISFAGGEFKPGSEPDGFRGNKWGMDISILKDMKYFGTNPSCGEIKEYTKKNDNLRFVGAKLKRIEYGFWGGKFYSVGGNTNGSVNWSRLKDAIFEKFGRGSQPNECIEYYNWFGSITKILLGYDKVSEEGFFYMFSTEISIQETIKQF